MESSPAYTYFGLFLNSDSSRELNLKGDEHFWPQSINQHASRAMLHSQQCDYSWVFFDTWLVYTLKCLIIFISLLNFIYSSHIGFSFSFFLFLLRLPASNGLPVFCMDEKVGGVAGLPFFWNCLLWRSSLYARSLSLCWKYCLFLLLLFAMQIHWAFLKICVCLQVYILPVLCRKLQF